MTQIICKLYKGAKCSSVQCKLFIGAFFALQSKNPVYICKNSHKLHHSAIYTVQFPRYNIHIFTRQEVSAWRHVMYPLLKHGEN